MNVYAYFSRLVMGALALAAAHAFAAAPRQRSGFAIIAELDRATADYRRCIDNSEGITSNMADCDGAMSDVLNPLIERAYAAAATGLSPARKRWLDASQKAWMASREPHCLSGLDHSGGYYGTLEMLMLEACLIDSEEQRIRWLVRHIKRH